MKNAEPTLERIEDYNGEESREKRLTIWIVILSGLLIGTVYGMLQFSSTVSNAITTNMKIIKY